MAVQDAQESDLPPGETLDKAKTKHRKRISINPGTFVRLEELPASLGVPSLLPSQCPCAHPQQSLPVQALSVSALPCTSCLMSGSDGCARCLPPHIEAAKHGLTDPTCLTAVHVQMGCAAARARWCATRTPTYAMCPRQSCTSCCACLRPSPSGRCRRCASHLCCAHLQRHATCSQVGDLQQAVTHELICCSAQKAARSQALLAVCRC